MAAKFLSTAQTEADRWLLQFPTYEAYLEFLSVPQDMCYLESTECTLTIAELGYRSSGETLSREQFERRFAAALNYLYPPYKSVELASAGLAKGDNLQKALAIREGVNRLGVVSTILFVKYFTKNGSEISGYIDYAEKLSTGNLKPFFRENKRIILKPTDLGYYNWKKGKVFSNESLNYKPLQDPDLGLLFRNKLDRKIINPSPNSLPGENSSRKRIRSDMYDIAVIFDHIVIQKI